MCSSSSMSDGAGEATGDARSVPAGGLTARVHHRGEQGGWCCFALDGAAVGISGARRRSSGLWTPIQTQAQTVHLPATRCEVWQRIGVHLSDPRSACWAPRTYARPIGVIMAFILVTLASIVL